MLNWYIYELGHGQMCICFVVKFSEKNNSKKVSNMLTKKEWIIFN